MKEKISRFLIITFLLVLTLPFASCSKAKLDSTQPLSPAMNLLASDNFMALSAKKGESIRFSADDFARALNLESVESLTVTAVPPTTDGTLRVGSTVLTGEQTLSAAAIELMTYVSSSNITNSEFKFRVNDSPYEMTCKLYMLDSKNYAPTLSTAPKIATEVSTYENVSYFGRIPCYDIDGDQTFIEVVKYPEKGILVIEDAAVGSYCYVPYNDAVGKDSFECVARDIYGNYSPALNISLEIKRSESPARFVDLIDSPYHNSALSMNEAGIMSGTQVGSSLYFYPDRTLSRAEFTVLAMNAAGITDVNPSSSTVFADDADIPSNMKHYVSAAYDLGYVSGIMVDGKLCFLPQKEISRAEAAVMLANMLDIATPTIKPVFSDEDAIPSWAYNSLSSLASVGVISNTEVGIRPLEPLTRAEAASILCNFIEVANK
jgi:hypothetical protein